MEVDSDTRQRLKKHKVCLCLIAVIGDSCGLAWYKLFVLKSISLIRSMNKTSLSSLQCMKDGLVCSIRTSLQNLLSTDFNVREEWSTGVLKSDRH